jgi:peptidoglycan/LPS O-acetylase OafA/YrhL
MAGVMPLRREGPFPEIRDAFTQKRTWLFALGYLAILISAVRWPLVWELSLLCFPAGVFCWVAISSGAIRRPPMLRIVITVVAVHCLLLAGTLYLWSKSPQRIDGDFGFCFIAIEVAMIALLMHFAGNGRETYPPSK